MLQLLHPELPLNDVYLRKLLCRFASWDDAFEHRTCWRLNKSVWRLVQVDEVLGFPVPLDPVIWRREPKPRDHEWILYAPEQNRFHTCPVYK